MIVLCLFTIVLAIVVALWEIQIEGKNGWASSLPCWKRDTGIVVRILGGRPWTGYHTYLIAFVILMMHFPFVLYEDWGFRKELQIWGVFFSFFMLEDFLWFVFNSAFGLKKFRKEYIWWHPTWWGPVPDFYWWYATLSAVLFAISQRV